MKGDTITLMPRQSVTFTLKFMPSALGDSDHSCRISFYSEQVGGASISVQFVRMHNMLSMQCNVARKKLKVEFVK